jgi:trehalose/maltose hydrolase-like predicted phosphorylase
MKYRTARLKQAADIARCLGFAGAKYPVESAATGGEQIWTGGLYAWMELEETGCVAWALEQVFAQSGDAMGAPAIFAIAEFFASRVSQCAAPLNTSLFCLDGVMGPDESHAPVNSSSFTSAIAASSLRSGVRAAALLGVPAGLNWTAIAEGMYVPYDEAWRYHPEFEGYVRILPPGIRWGYHALIGIRKSKRRDAQTGAM